MGGTEIDYTLLHVNGKANMTLPHPSFIIVHVLFTRRAARPTVPLLAISRTLTLNGRRSFLFRKSYYRWPKDADGPSGKLRSFEHNAERIVSWRCTLQINRCDDGVRCEQTPR